MCSNGAMGSKIVYFGGHGTGGFFQKHHIYFDDVIVLERESVKWTRPNVSGTSGPTARAYHTMTTVGSQILIFGGYNGKVTFGDAWWLLPDGMRPYFHCRIVVVKILTEVYVCRW